MLFRLISLLMFLILGTPTTFARMQAAPIHLELKKHTEHFQKKVYKIGDRVYSAVGYSLGNIIMVVGHDGVIVVDTGTHPTEAAEAWAELRKKTDKPVKAVVYTHFHPDHWGGVKAIISQAQVDSGTVKIIAHRTMLDNVIHQGGAVGPILAMRTAYSFGLFLSPEDHEGMNHGIGPEITPGISSFIRPNTFVDNALKLEIAGVKMLIKHVPSEAPDEIAVYLEDDNILLSGEAIQGPTLPNIHTLRGTKFRDPYLWYKSLDKLRIFKAEHLVPSHGQPIYGKEKVEEVIRMTRDGIQFIHDQTLRHMNKGATPDELVNLVKMPPYLSSYTPFLREYYGTVKHSVRQIYNGYLGWFAGDPVDLNPLPAPYASRRYIALMGGRGNVLNHAEKAMKELEYQWAAELMTHLIRIDKTDQDARNIKAHALRELGLASMNINWRNWYLTASYELEGKIDPAKGLVNAVGFFSSPDIIAQWPLSKILEGLSVRLKTEISQDKNLKINFTAIDTNEHHGLEVRKSIMQFHGQATTDATVTIQAPRQAIIGLLMGKLSIAQFTALPVVSITGNTQDLTAFMAMLDPFLSPIKLTVH